MEKINQPEGEADGITTHPTTGTSNPRRQDGRPEHRAPSPGPTEAIAHEAPEPTDPPVTYAEAVGHSPYDLLRELEAHALYRFEVEQERDDPKLHLAELALSSAVIRWWAMWQPIMMHRALKTGASLSEVAAAAGTSETEVYERWSAWADVQSRLVIINGRPALDPAEAEAIRARLTDPSPS